MTQLKPASNMQVESGTIIFRYNLNYFGALLIRCPSEPVEPVVVKFNFSFKYGWLKNTLFDSWFFWLVPELIMEIFCLAKTFNNSITKHFFSDVVSIVKTIELHFILGCWHKCVYLKSHCDVVHDNWIIGKNYDFNKTSAKFVSKWMKFRMFLQYAACHFKYLF